MRSPGNRNQRVAPNPCNQRKKQAEHGNKEPVCHKTQQSKQTNKNPKLNKTPKMIKKNPKNKI